KPKQFSKKHCRSHPGEKIFRCCLFRHTFGGTGQRMREVCSKLLQETLRVSICGNARRRCSTRRSPPSHWLKFLMTSRRRLPNRKSGLKRRPLRLPRQIGELRKPCWKP